MRTKKPRTSLVSHFAIVSALDLYRDTNEGASNGLSRRCGHHLVLDLRAIRRPIHTHRVDKNKKNPPPQRVIIRDIRVRPCRKVKRKKKKVRVPLALATRNIPVEKDDLVAQATLLLLKLKVVHGPATLVLGQIGEEILVVLRRRLFVLDDLRLGVVESEDDVLVLLPELELLEHLQALLVYGYAGRLGKGIIAIC